MPIPAARASLAERNATWRPFTRIVPSCSACTPAMIFIRVLFPAPFSPTSPWISPARKLKSTSRSAITPPNVFPIPLISRTFGGLEGVTRFDSTADAGGISRRSDEEVGFHPCHPGRVGLGDDGTIGDDVFGDAAGAGLLAVHHRGNAGDDRAVLVTSQSAGVVSSTLTFGYFETIELKPRARPCAPVCPSAPWVIVIVPLPPIPSMSACVTAAPMNSLSGAKKL